MFIVLLKSYRCLLWPPNSYLWLCILLIGIALRICVLMINFRVMIQAPLILTFGILILKRSFIGLMEILFKVEHKDKEINNHKGHWEYGSEHTQYASSHKNQRYLANPQEVMAVVEVEAHMLLQCQWTIPYHTSVGRHNSHNVASGGGGGSPDELYRAGSKSSSSS